MQAGEPEDSHYEAEQRQRSEEDLFNEEEEAIMPKATKPKLSAEQRWKLENDRQRAEKSAIEATQANSRAERLARRGGGAISDAPVSATNTDTTNQAAPNARQTALQRRQELARQRKAEEAARSEQSRMEDVDIQADIARQTAQDDSSRSAQRNDPMERDDDIQAALDSQFRSDMSRPNASRETTQAPISAEDELQAALNRQFEAELAPRANTANNTEAQQQAPIENDVRAQELAAQNEALRDAIAIADSARLEALSRQETAQSQVQLLTEQNQQLSQTANEAQRARLDIETRTGNLTEQNIQLTNERDAANAARQEIEQAATQKLDESNRHAQSAIEARQAAETRASELAAANAQLTADVELAKLTANDRGQSLSQTNMKFEAAAKLAQAQQQATQAKLQELTQRNAANAKAAETSELARKSEETARKSAEAKTAEMEGRFKTATQNAVKVKMAKEAAEKNIQGLKSEIKTLSNADERAKFSQSQIQDLKAQNATLSKGAQETEAARKVADNKIVTLTQQAKDQAKEIASKDQQLKNADAARKTADAKAGELDTKLQAAVKDVATEKQARGAAEKTAQLLKTQNAELSKAVQVAEVARKDAENKALSSKDQQLKDAEAARENAETKAAGLQTKLQAETRNTGTEKQAREASEKNAQELKNQNAELSKAAQAAEASRDKTEARISKMIDDESTRKQGDAKQGQQLKDAQAKIAALEEQVSVLAKAGVQARVEAIENGLRAKQAEAELTNATGSTGKQSTIKQELEWSENDSAVDTKTPQLDNATVEKAARPTNYRSPSISSDVGEMDIDSDVASNADGARSAKNKTPELNPDDFADDSEIEAELAAEDAARKAKDAQSAKDKSPELNPDDFADDSDIAAELAAEDAARKAKDAQSAKDKSPELNPDDFADDSDIAAELAAEDAARTATQQRSPSATLEPEVRPSIETPSRQTTPAGVAPDPRHAVKGDAWQRAGKMYVPPREYDRMLAAGIKPNGYALHADASKREAVLKSPVDGSLQSPRAYKTAYGKTNFEARMKAEGLNPKLGDNWPAKDATRPDVVVKLKNGNLVDGNSKGIAVAAGKAGLEAKFGKENVFVQNLNGKGIGTGNYRDSETARARAQSPAAKAKLDARLQERGVTPQPAGVQTHKPLKKMTSTAETRGTTPAQNANGKGGVYNLKNQNGKAAAATTKATPARPNNAYGNGYRNGQNAAARPWTPPAQGGANNRQTSPTTTINLTVNGAVGHGSATPNVAATAAPQSKYTPKLDDRSRTQEPIGRN